MVKVLIGLGGNLGDPPRAFATALRALAAAHDLRAWSRLHRTTAVGPPQPDYWNLAAVLYCACDPTALLTLCHQLERAAGRRREDEERWGPRTLDLDLLLVDGVVSDDPALTLPHPRFHQRLFALLPAAEVAPHWRHPVLGTTVGELARQLWRASLGPPRTQAGLKLPP